VPGTFLENDGVCVVHFTYAKNYPRKKLVALLTGYIPLLSNLKNLIKGKKFFAPEMQMNTYDVNRLFLTIQKTNVSNCYTEFTNHGGELGIVVYFRKNKGHVPN